MISLGSRQHGLPLLKVASLQMDLETLRRRPAGRSCRHSDCGQPERPGARPLKARVEALFTRQEVSLN
ncbi:MAG: hypothetical protein ACLU3I_09970 [Acutalibacteraceae bacterium]